MECNRDCAFGGECSCQATPAVSAELQRVSHRHRHDGLVTDETGKLTLRSTITPERRERMLSEPDAEPAVVMARWPGGLGDEPVFGELA